jgi:hypothetical protein
MMAFGGNAQPQLAVTRRLVERAHEVRVLAHRAARERIEATGAQFVEFRQSVPDMDLTTRETDTLRDWEARTRFGAGMRVLRNGLLPFVLDTSRECAGLLRDWPADVVVMDWMLTGAAVAAERASVPAVALVHCPYPLRIVRAQVGNEIVAAVEEQKIDGFREDPERLPGVPDSQLDEIAKASVGQIATGEVHLSQPALGRDERAPAGVA